MALKLNQLAGKYRAELSIAASLFLISLTFQTCTQEQKVEEQKITASNPALSTLTIPVEGMSCGACVSNVKKTLKSLEGIAEVEVSLENREAKVTYADERVSPEQVRQAINALGYKAGKPEIKKQ